MTTTTNASERYEISHQQVCTATDEVNGIRISWITGLFDVSMQVHFMRPGVYSVQHYIDTTAQLVQYVKTHYKPLI